ncbi:MAG: hypothetical protein AABZ08_04235 [Planctomycetota bacterium]
MFRMSFALLVCLLCSPALAQQRADPDYKPVASDPAYKTTHPRVLFDEAHHNFHTASGRYKPFAELITSDGCVITPNKQEFSSGTLKGFNILIIANALGDERMGTARAEAPAFTEEECDAVRDWVKAGGSLLLITDHYPTGSAAETLGQRFDMDFSKGSTQEYTFTKDTGLGDHAILQGRSESERVKMVGTFTGQSLKGPRGSAEFFKLPGDAKEKVPDPENPFRNKPLTRSAKGRCQGVALNFGKGRVVALGEAAMLSAQLSGDGRAFGMNVKGLDNQQFALNVIHWLTGLLEPAESKSKSDRKDE